MVIFAVYSLHDICTVALVQSRVNTSLPGDVSLHKPVGSPCQSTAAVYVGQRELRRQTQKVSAHSQRLKRRGKHIACPHASLSNTAPLSRRTRSELDALGAAFPGVPEESVWPTRQHEIGQAAQRHAVSRDLSEGEEEKELSALLLELRELVS